MKDKGKRTVLLTVLLMLLPVWGMAEGERGGRDITFVMLALGVSGLTLLVYAWRRQILPFLEKHALAEEAEMVVHCVEAQFGRGHGQEKWNAALEKMAQRGWNVDREEIRECLKAAWEILNVSQIGAGVKTGTTENQG